MGPQLESTKTEVSEEAALPEKTFVFSDFPAKTLSGIRLRLTQTGEGKGIAYLTFTQTCGSRGSDVASGPDWVFDVNLSDGKAPLSETFISAPGTTAAEHNWSS